MTRSGERSVRACLGSGEQGQTLVLVLAFLIAIGVLAGALAGQITPSFVHSNVVKSINDDVAAADQGIRYGIQSLKTYSNICPPSAPGIPPSPSSLPDYVTPDTGLTVHVQCMTYQGFSPGGSGWAVITNDSGAASFTDASGGNKAVTGPIFNAGGWNLNPGKTTTVMDGNIVTQGLGCTYPPNLLVTPVPPFQKICNSPSIPVPVPAHQLPTIYAGGPPPMAPTPTYISASRCRILYPGTYTSPPDLSGDVYMVSGIYYFNDLGNLTIGTTLFGGQPKPPEKLDSTTGAPCASDASAGAPSGQYGVEIIFGGNTTLSVGNNDTLELFTRVNTVSDDGSTPYITLYQVPCPGTWPCPPQTTTWNPTSLPPATQFLSMGNGAHVWGSIHGAVYAPQGSVGVFATDTSEAVLGGGTDVFDLTLQSSASASGLLVSVGVTPGARYTVVKATVAVPGLAKPIISRAVVQIANDAARTTTIDSWRTCQDKNAADPSCAGPTM